MIGLGFFRVVLKAATVLFVSKYTRASGKLTLLFKTCDSSVSDRYY